jgi:hypothetical protein
MERLVNPLIRSCKGAERPCREWWAVLGTVAEALEGLGSWSLGIESAGPDTAEFDCANAAVFFFRASKYDGGKCFALYNLSTESSSWRRQYDRLCARCRGILTLKALLYKLRLSPSRPSLSFSTAFS